MTDYSYEVTRNSFIPAAARHADKLHGKRPDADYFQWARKWNLAYLEEMDRLVAEHIYKRKTKSKES